MPAAQSDPLSLHSLSGDASSAFGIYGGLRRGGIAGTTSAAINASKLATGSGLVSGSYGTGLNAAAGIGGNALGIYGGLQQGGIVGDTNVAVNAAQLAARGASTLTGAAGTLGAVAGAAAVPLSVYNFVNNYESGKTGSNTLNGAAAGAAIGSVIPVVGTAIGAIVGAAVGALSSAFGPGAKDPETAIVQNLIDATAQSGNKTGVAANVQNPYLELAGLMDRRSSTLPMYAQYGRMGEQKFTNDMVGKINQAAQQGVISQKSTPQEVYNKVVAPWVASMGQGWGNVGTTYTATTQGLLQDMVSQYMSGQAVQDWKSIGGQQPFQGLAKYGALGFGGTTSPPTQQNTAQARAPAAPTAGAIAAHNATGTMGIGGGSGLLTTAAGPVATMLGSTAFHPNPIQAASDAAVPGDGESPSTDSGGGLSGLLSGAGSFLGNLTGGAGGLGGALPYLAAGAAGFEQAGAAQKQNQQQAQAVSDLGKPYTQAGQQLLQNGMNGQLDPAHQNVVDTLKSQGQNLIDSASPLATIANTAFANYAAGQLNPGQQQQIDAWTTSAKQQLRQTLSSSGISDSSVLASQDAAIDSQATQLKSNLMAQNLQVGDQQYAQWLTSTQAGQQLQAQGAQYAATSIDTMLSQALSLGEVGMGQQTEGIKLAIQGDQALSNNIANLMKSLTGAYAVANKPAGTSGGGATGGAGSAVGGALGKAAGGAAGSGGAPLGGNSGLYAAGSAALARLSGATEGNTISSQYGTPGEPGNIETVDPNSLLQTPGLDELTTAGIPDFLNGGYAMNSDNTVDTSTFNNYFYDPSSADVPAIDFGG